MAKLFGKEYTRAELMQRVGDVFQVAGVRGVRLTDGSEEGVQAYEVKTGSGFNFTVLASRGLDISTAEHRGRALAWRSSTGDVAPQFYEPEGLRWLYSFYGGLVVTCGLTAAGAPSVDEGRELGLHGRFSNTPAKNVCVRCEWDGDDYMMEISGKMRETIVFRENLTLTRTIRAKMGEDRFQIHDVVENEGHDPQPLMLLYHINGGFPAVDADSELVAPSLSAKSRDAEAEHEKELACKFTSPIQGFKERVYYHDMKPCKYGYVTTALVNRSFGGGKGFGFYVKYRKDQLPVYTEWKMMGQGTYVVGMEPANCHVEGRDKERERGTLQFIQPGERREFDLEIGCLTSKAQIEELDRRTAETLKG